MYGESINDLSVLFSLMYAQVPYFTALKAFGTKRWPLEGAIVVLKGEELTDTRGLIKTKVANSSHRELSSHTYA